MSNEPKVSVIVIFLNAERFLQEALDSILAQTYRNWELLLVNDGSTDGSAPTARAFAAAHPERVRYLEHKGGRNLGMSASRNLGIKESTGPYIAFLDADDVWLPKYLERQVALLNSQPEAGMVWGAIEYWYSWTGEPKDKDRDYTRRLDAHPEGLIEPPKLLTLFLRNRAGTPATCSVLLRREAVERAGGFEESFRGLHEDQAFFAKVCLKERVFVTSECLARYRQHPDSCCSVAMKNGGVERAEQSYLNWLAEYVAKNGGRQTEAWEILQRTLWPGSSPLLFRLLTRSQRDFVKKARSAILHLRGRQPRVAYEPELVPPLDLMRLEGVEVIEEWFRWAEEWSMILRVYGRISRESSVFELGCGLGRIAFPLRYILSPDGSYVGVDGSREKIDFLERNFHRAHPNFRFIQIDSRQSFPYPSDSFDVVYAASAFTHALPETAADRFREAGRVLKPGGRCLFGLFLLDNYRPGRARPLGFNRPLFNFDYQYADYGDSFATADREDPESMTAYSLRLIERFASDAGLVFALAPVPGIWSGSSSSWVGAHDLIVLTKR